MRILAAPLKGDRQIISGESGAVTLGSLFSILKDEYYEDLRKELKIDKNSKILIFNTEGDTDPIKYKDIVWDGEYTSK